MSPCEFNLIREQLDWVQADTGQILLKRDPFKCAIHFDIQLENNHQSYAEQILMEHDHKKSLFSLSAVCLLFCR